ncbi:hypothetical protein SHIRM173S_09333 [Streptomyces hirsutus]
MAAAGRRRAGGDTARDRQRLRRLRAPACRAAEAAAAASRGGSPLRLGRARPGTGRAREHRVPRRAADRGGVRLRDGRAARTAARRDDADHPSAAQRPAGSDGPGPAAGALVHRPVRSARPGRPVHHGHLGRAVGAGQRTSGAPARGGAVRHRHNAGDERGVPGVHRGRRLRRAALVDRGGLGPHSPQLRQRPALLAPGRRAVAAASLRRDRGRAARRAGAARVLVRGGRVRPLGRAPTAHRGRVGEGRPARPGRRPLGALSLGRRRSRLEHANLGQRHLRPAPAGSYPASGRSGCVS